MQVSVIIINYNTKDMTMDCINSVFEKTKDVEFEIILVDNGSVDGSKELFEKDDRITYYYLDENLGFGKANNYGIERANGEFIFCLNSDTLLINNAIALLYNFAKDRKDVGAVGGQLYSKNGEKNKSNFNFPNYNYVAMIFDFFGPLLTKCLRTVYRVVFPKKDKQQSRQSNEENTNNEYYFVDYVIGADMMIKKELLDKFGAFDPDFFMYAEEAELQHRMTKHRYRSALYPKAQIIHFEEASSKTNTDTQKNTKRKLWLFKSNIIYMKKTLNRFCYYYYRFFLTLHTLPELFKLNKEERQYYLKVLFNY